MRTKPFLLVRLIQGMFIDTSYKLMPQLGFDEV